MIYATSILRIHQDSRLRRSSQNENAEAKTIYLRLNTHRSGGRFYQNLAEVVNVQNQMDQETGVE